MILGILGILVCSVLSPFAWVYGKRAEAAVDASNGAYGGRDMATAGKVLGIIGTVLLVIGVLVGVVFLIALIASSASTA
jgi:hypothetical protein